MNQFEKDFCFCTLALQPKYRLLAQRLAGDLAQYSPETLLVVGTDEPIDFKEKNNVIAFKHRQEGILHCYNDKRFVLEKALSKCRTAIIIDADTRIVRNIPNNIEWMPGITGRSENLIQHVNKHTPERLPYFQTLAKKLNLSLDNVPWVGESLFIISRDGGKEKEFLKQWGEIGNYLELNGIHSGEGNGIGLAATKIGWTVNLGEWKEIKAVTQHLDASDEKTSTTVWENWQRRLVYHYRLNRMRVKALKDFNFYYR
ncbi:hypothetical protein [Limnofasciculus baicalensis]|uniref:Uncharacterized protein n=1 Tax=Limnofasciculus baicalensis BBK-W-15 TaxID=2699891 RepID=A0AAE3GRC2_9CYAN|nr:hypothetical protein [Limnofasciculus baicalensis]MCP2729295.1 hypothetical protein [Limnofasciculus baicalensis BBK-W-15]